MVKRLAFMRNLDRLSRETLVANTQFMQKSDFCRFGPMHIDI